MSDDLRGRFIWYELLTLDPDAAVDFYTDLIGWGTAPFETDGQQYTMWTNGEVPIGGLMRLPDEAIAGGATPHWLAYVGTPDVDATAEQATRLGGTVLVPPKDIPTVGRFTVLQDPTGSLIAAYAPERPSPAPESSRPGEFSWHELAATDHEAAFGFYSELFGWEKTDAMDMGEDGIYQMYGRGGPPLGGMYTVSENMPAPPGWLHYIMVDDVRRKAERVKELGGQVLNGPMEVPGGDLIAQCLDPQGALFAIHSVAQQE